MVIFAAMVIQTTVFSLFYRLRNIAEHACTSGVEDFSNTRTTLSPMLIRYFYCTSKCKLSFRASSFYVLVHGITSVKAHEILKKKEFYKDLEIGKWLFECF